MRTEKGLTQKELSARLGFTERVVGHYESGHSQPSIDVIIKLCEILECSADYLLGIKEY